MSITMGHQLANSFPNPPFGRGALFLDPNDTLAVKDADGAVQPVQMVSSWVPTNLSCTSTGANAVFTTDGAAPSSSNQPVVPYNWTGVLQATVVGKIQNSQERAVYTGIVTMSKGATAASTAMIGGSTLTFTAVAADASFGTLPALKLSANTTYGGIYARFEDGTPAGQTIDWTMMFQSLTNNEWGTTNP